MLIKSSRVAAYGDAPLSFLVPWNSQDIAKCVCVWLIPELFLLHFTQLQMNLSYDAKASELMCFWVLLGSVFEAIQLCLED